MLQLYEPLGVPVEPLLTGNGREFYGKADSHPYSHLRPHEAIDCYTTRMRSPQIAGFVERTNGAVRHGCFRVDKLTTSNPEPADIPRDLDRLLRYDNLDQRQQGCRLRGRAPSHALREPLGVETTPSVVAEPTQEDSQQAA